LRRAWGFFCTFLAFLALLPSTTGQEPTQSALQFFTSKIEPILVNRCYECHSVEADKVKGGLLVDSQQGLLAGGDTGPAIVPGDPEQSRLILAVRHTDEDLQMPPKEKLSNEEIAALEEWVRMGAPD